MKISQLISKLEAMKAKHGDLDVVAVGHPGELGFALDRADIEVDTRHPDDPVQGTALFLIF